MIRRIARTLRFALKAERILLAYEAWGYDEEATLNRWRADLTALMMEAGTSVRVTYPDGSVRIISNRIGPAA